MGFSLLPVILEQEGNDFHRNFRWKPTKLVPDQFRKHVLGDVATKLKQLEAAEPELRQLDRPLLYVNALKRMRYNVRQAHFAWRTDDLKFFQSVTEFFSDYGTVLRHLQLDKARGRFSPLSSVGV